MLVSRTRSRKDPVLRIDETSGTLVAPQAGGLVAEPAPARDEFLSLVAGSWETFAGELGLPHLRLVAREPAPGVDLLAVDEEAARPRAGRGRRGRELGRRAAARPRLAGAAARGRRLRGGRPGDRAVALERA